MDDNTFDKKIKEKAEAYRDTGFDEHALQGFRDRMSGAAYEPWYTPYRKVAGYAAAVAIISLINFGLFSYFYDAHDQELLTTIQKLKAWEVAYDQLEREYQVLKMSAVDTVYIYRERSNGIRQANSNAQARKSTGNYQLVAWYGSSDDRHVRLGAVEELSEEIKGFLAKYKLGYLDEEGDVYLRQDNLDEPKFVAKKGYEGLLDPTTSDILIAAVDQEVTPKIAETKKSAKKRLSVEILRDIEKQKMDGVGFQYGPEVDILKANVDLGNRGVGINAGIMTEFILSPALRIESGVKYQFTHYSISKEKDLQREEMLDFPALQNELGVISDIRVDNHSLGLPLHLKYNYPLSRDNYVFISAGVTPQMLFLQKFRYSYQYDIDTGSEDDYAVNIEANKHVDDVYLNPGTMDVAFGVEKKLKNSSILQLSAFYNRSIRTLGIEEQELAMVGLRSALKFRVK
ncbi:hypothetical protein C900_00101 [Fulvivirga imtechensis AK7]|uniref:Outer membrane protein beta-barrel domain-containing protein n=1 Tax=Fulvivirga imtechensis AK7 TaxID=1237149 RepID=L8JVE5_9BACT|nr:outer membrane beta-barrel protein [Fulvivirga imtechensis]ELR73021.1 hypothetical protein C900_00101 [Fulvivirga imtechensis AK7]